MINLNSSYINRILTLLDNDIKRLTLELSLLNDDTSAVEKAKNYMSGANIGKYELAPHTKDSIQKQLTESREIHKQISDEVNKATFVFGLSAHTSTGAGEGFGKQ